MTNQVVEEAAAEAVKEFLPKAGKLEVAEKAMLLGDSDDLMAKERHNVQRYMEKKVFGDEGRPFNS